MGEKVQLERVGTDGDMEKAARLYQELDGKVDAFGVGGAVLGLLLEKHWYPMHSINPMVRYIRQTPVVDGTGLKITLERQCASVVRETLAGAVHNKHALIMSGLDRYGQARSFLDNCYECVMGDLMFTLGIPIPIRTDRNLKLLGKLLIPTISRLPFEMLYPTGEAQESRNPKFNKTFKWASVIAGDCHFITRYMPDRLDGKIIITNTTTPEDKEIFRNAGVKYLITTTPVYEGRSFGTNLLEAGLVAVTGRRQPVDYSQADDYFAEMENLVQELGMKPVVQELF